MKHAGAAALDAIEPLLTQVRALPGLKEKSRGNFYFKSRAVLHFHEDPAGMFADLRAPGDPDFTRLQVDTSDGPSVLIERLGRALGAS
jgi:hypothetical protein